VTTQELHILKKDLIARDHTTLNSLYAENKKDCFKILLSKSYASLDQAEQVYTDAILILRQNIISGKVTELTNPLSYLVSICRNLVRNENRSQLKKAKKEEQVRLLFYNNGYNEVEDTAEKTQRIQICKKALSTLTERCQQILTAYYVHRLRMKEIAEELGLSSGDVAKTLKSRCYKSWISAVKELGI